jgi:drug/metabolite transporter (DMT)-like permease
MSAVTPDLPPLPGGPAARAGGGGQAIGLALVLGSAVVWSFGGTIGRFLDGLDSWTVVFWRSVWASAFLLGFMLLRDGPRGTAILFRSMGLAGLGVGLCFALASVSFVVALAYTSVAKILLMQAGVPLIAALMGWALFRERVSGGTWVAIAGVILGVGIMVSDSFAGRIAPLGDGLALLIAVAFATATVITRRHAHLRMTPAVCLGTAMAGLLAASQADSFAVGAAQMGWLIAFGALNLGLGLAMFVTGARLIPATLAALVGTAEPVLGPVWVWLIHGEVPLARTILGGGVVMAALLGHLLAQFLAHRRG